MNIALSPTSWMFFLLTLIMLSGVYLTRNKLGRWFGSVLFLGGALVWMGVALTAYSVNPAPQMRVVNDVVYRISMFHLYVNHALIYLFFGTVQLGLGASPIRLGKCLLAVHFVLFHIGIALTLVLLLFDVPLPRRYLEYEAVTAPMAYFDELGAALCLISLGVLIAGIATSLWKRQFDKN